MEFKANSIFASFLYFFIIIIVHFSFVHYILDRYEYEEGIPLCNVHTYKCPNCQEFIFSEAQVEEIEKRTEMIKSEMFAFERKVTVSGRSLVINLPEDLVRHMNIAKGKIVKIIPGGKKKFIVEV